MGSVKSQQPIRLGAKSYGKPEDKDNQMSRLF